MCFESYTITLDLPRPTPGLQILDYTGKSYEHVRERERRNAEANRKRRRKDMESTLRHHQCLSCGRLDTVKRSAQPVKNGVLDVSDVYNNGAVDSNATEALGQSPFEAYTLSQPLISWPAESDRLVSFRRVDADFTSITTAVAAVGTTSEGRNTDESRHAATTSPSNTVSPEAIEIAPGQVASAAADGPDRVPTGPAADFPVELAVASIQGSSQPTSPADVAQHHWTEQMDRDLLHFRETARLTWSRVQKYYPAVELSDLKVRYKSLKQHRLNMENREPTPATGSDPPDVTAQSKSFSGEPSNRLQVENASASDNGSGSTSSWTKPHSIHPSPHSTAMRARRRTQHGIKRQPKSSTEPTGRVYATQTEQCPPELPESRFGRKRRRPHHDPSDGY